MSTVGAIPDSSGARTLDPVSVLVPMLASVTIYGVVMWGLVRLAVRVRRRRCGGSLMQPFDEIWHPTAHQARLDIEVQQEQPAPSPLPGDGLL